jgi:hypothetical protein
VASLALVHPATTAPKGIGPSGFGFLSVAVNFGSRALSYRRYGGVHCPLIEEIAPDQGMGWWTWSL